jgi:hypothetical protein
MKKYLILCLFAIGMMAACNKTTPEEKPGKPQISKPQNQTLEMEETVYILTLSQKDSLVGTKIIPPYEWYFNPVQDCDSVWVVDQMQVDECTNPDVMWVKNLPPKTWCAPPPPPGPIESF